MKLKLFALLLLAGSSMFAGSSFYFGVGIGGHGYGGGRVVVASPPPVAPAYYYARPAYPGPGYSWVDGYYYPVGARYAWRSGYWARPPYARSYWVGPRYYGGRYHHGYWGRR